jgi:hypothetical protein
MLKKELELKTKIIEVSFIVWGGIATLSIWFPSCEFSQKTNLRNLEWVESQVLCVFWTPNFKGRDTLPAINYVLSSPYDFNFEDYEFYFEFPFDDNFQKIALKKVPRVVTINDKLKFGLVLESANLFQFFDENFDLEGGTCYEMDLLRILGQGKLFIAAENKVSEIGKSSDFKFFIGLKPRIN